MIEEKALVVGIENDYVQVESTVKSTCSSCQQVNDCGSGQVAKALPKRALKLQFKNDFNLIVGDSILIGIPEKNLLASAWQVYLLPLIGLISFAGIGQLLSSSFSLNHELITIILSAVGGFLGFKLASYLQNKLSVQENLSPSILKKLPKNINIVEIQP